MPLHRTKPDIPRIYVHSQLRFEPNVREHDGHLVLGCEFAMGQRPATCIPELKGLYIQAVACVASYTRTTNKLPQLRVYSVRPISHAIDARGELKTTERRNHALESYD